MINWNKPIETVDGRKARVVETIFPNFNRIIWVEGIGPGDVFLVNDEGHRCDERAVYSKRKDPIIRNAPIKRKAWIRLPIHDYYKADTKEECEASITSPNYKAVYCEWEEEP